MVQSDFTAIYLGTLQRRSEQACLARQDLGHTHLAHVLECVTRTMIMITLLSDWSCMLVALTLLLWTHLALRFEVLRA